jgi:formylglycine-generating enzyme required for sulfatase activity
MNMIKKILLLSLFLVINLQAQFFDSPSVFKVVNGKIIPVSSTWRMDSTYINGLPPMFGAEFIKGNGYYTSNQKIVAHPFLSNNYLIRDRWGNYNAMVYIPQFNWTPTLEFSAVGRASETFGANLDQDSVIINASASAVNDAYKDCYIVYNGEWRLIKGYIGATKKAVIDSFSVRPTAANSYVIHAVHPAFIVDNTIIKGFYIGKYEASIVNNTGAIQTYTTTYAGASWDTPAEWVTANKGAHSRANIEPQVNIDYDAAKASCEALNADADNIATTGKFYLQSNSMWAAVAIWVRQQALVLSLGWVRGNNLYGTDIDDRSITFSHGNDNPLIGVSGSSRGLGGSGGIKTSHNKEESGIYDLNGNVWEWVGGFRVNEGKIYVAGNSNTSAMGGGNSIDATEANYYDTGVYYNWDGTSSTFTFSTANRGTDMVSTYKSQQFNYTNANTTGILKRLAIAPNNQGADYGSDYYYVRNYGERLAIRGGLWSDGSNAGVFYLYLLNARSYVNPYIGFRLAFVKN